MRGPATQDFGEGGLGCAGNRCERAAMKSQRDVLYVFFCHLEWRDRQNSDAYKEVVAALDDNDADIRQVAESLLHRDAETAGKLDINVTESKDGALVCLSGRIDVDSSP